MMLLSLLPALSLLLTLTPSAAVPTELQGTGMTTRHGQAAAAPRPASDVREVQRRQATRSDILARQQHGPAKRQQASPLPVPLPACVDVNPFGTEIYAVYTGGYPPYDRTLRSEYVTSQQECNVLCSANSQCESTDAASPDDQGVYCHVDTLLRTASSIIADASGSGSIRGVTCATSGYTIPEGVTCCNARV